MLNDEQKYDLVQEIKNKYDPMHQDFVERIVEKTINKIELIQNISLPQTYPIITIDIKQINSNRMDVIKRAITILQNQTKNIENKKYLQLSFI